MPVSAWEIALRLLVALGLGAVVGYDRQRRDHPAGLRTHVLVALASATFMLVSSQLAFFQHYGPGEQYRVDPSRIASGIVMGMGFLGAGSIIRTNRGVRGLTTSASLWLVAALGMASAAGMYVLAVLAAAAAMFVLVGLKRWERRAAHRVDHLVSLVIQEAPFDREALLRDAGLDPLDVRWVSVQRDLVPGVTRLSMEVSSRSMADFDRALASLAEIPGVSSVRAERPWSTD
jgi:putative Mg2+ transporter-C (MgtC) family protein